MSALTANVRLNIYIQVSYGRDSCELCTIHKALSPRSIQGLLNSFASIPIRVLRLFYDSGKADRDVFDKRNVGIHLHEKLQGSHWAVLKTNIARISVFPGGEGENE